MEYSTWQNAPFRALAFEAPGDSRRRSPMRRGDAECNPASGSTLISMSHGEVCCTEAVRNFTLHCEEGALWITWPEYSGDAVVSAGQHLQISSRGTIVITAVERSSLWIPAGYTAETSRTIPARRLVVRSLP